MCDAGNPANGVISVSCLLARNLSIRISNAGYRPGVQIVVHCGAVIERITGAGEISAGIKRRILEVSLLAAGILALTHQARIQIDLRRREKSVRYRHGTIRGGRRAAAEPSAAGGRISSDISVGRIEVM